MLKFIIGPHQIGGLLFIMGDNGNPTDNGDHANRDNDDSIPEEVLNPPPGQQISDEELLAGLSCFSSSASLMSLNYGI